MSVAFDARKNFAISTVATAPVTPTAGTSLVLAAGDGANFPAAPFNAVIWPTGANPSRTNAEIVRVTAKSTDTLTITRAQESSTARSVIVGDQIIAGLTSKSLGDIEDVLNGVTSGAVLLTPTLTTPRFADLGHIDDPSGNEHIIFDSVASAVNELTINNAATAGVPGIAATGGDTNIHVQVIGKGNGLTKVSMLRQDDTTNAYKHNSIILTGWGSTVSPGTGSTISETVTFGITFAARPIVLISYGGDQASGAASYGSGDNAVHGKATVKCYLITTTNFVAYIWAQDATGWVLNNRQYYHWAAFGEL